MHKTVQLIGLIRAHWGEAGLERLIEARAAESLNRYTKTMEGVSKLQEKVARLAEVLHRDGYMAEWHAEGDECVLLLNHCPIYTAVKACPGLCKSEMATLQKVLGDDVSIERTEHIVNGDRRCAYRISNRM